MSRIRNSKQFALPRQSVAPQWKKLSNVLHSTTRKAKEKGSCLKIPYARIFLPAASLVPHPHACYASHRPPRLSSMLLLLFSALVPLSEPPRGPPFRRPGPKPYHSSGALLSQTRAHRPFLPLPKSCVRPSHTVFLSRTGDLAPHTPLHLPLPPFCPRPVFFARSAGRRSPETRPFREKTGLVHS